jgi:hypothetical protein
LFITADFVYVHVPKTGGTFVSTALQRWCDSTGRDYIDTAAPTGRATMGARDQHGAVCDLPRRHRNKPVLFCVRNPFEYYVSLYDFGWWHSRPEDEFDVERISQRFPSYPHLTFSEFVHAINDWHLWPKSDRQLGRFVEEHGIGLLTWKLITLLSLEPASVFADFAAFLERPFASRCFPELHALRTHCLSGDLIGFISGLGVASEETAFINNLGRIYPAEGGRRPDSHWRPYYDSALVGLVRRAERAVFARWHEFDT